MHKTGGVPRNPGEFVGTAMHRPSRGDFTKRSTLLEIFKQLMKLNFTSCACFESTYTDGAPGIIPTYRNPNLQPRLSQISSLTIATTSRPKTGSFGECKTGEGFLRSEAGLGILSLWGFECL